MWRGLWLCFLWAEDRAGPRTAAAAACTVRGVAGWWLVVPGWKSPAGHGGGRTFGTGGGGGCHTNRGYGVPPATLLSPFLTSCSFRDFFLLIFVIGS